MEKKNKAENQAYPDTQIKASVKFERLHTFKSPKVKVSFYSNQKHVEVDESHRINLPDELKDGETYKDGEIHSRKENSIIENPAE